MYEHTSYYQNGRIEIRLEYDADPSPPDEMGDCEPEFFKANNGNEMERKLKEEFEKPQKAVTKLASGDVFESKEGDWYYGIAEYSHGQSAFALCGSSRACNWPDPQWDVIPFVGWIKISKKLREDWGTGFNKAMIKANAEGYLETWEAYLNGNVFGYIVKAYDAQDKELEDDSCWGYYGEDDAIIDARTSAAYLAGKYHEMLGELKP